MINGTEGALRIYDDPAHTLVLIRRDGSVENYDVDQIQTNDNQTKSGIIDLFVDCLNDPSHEGISAESVLPAMRAVFASMVSSERGPSGSTSERCGHEKAPSSRSTPTAIMVIPIEEAIAGIRRAGFHYIELTATKGWTEHVFPDMPFERLLRFRTSWRRRSSAPLHERTLQPHGPRTHPGLCEKHPACRVLWLRLYRLLHREAHLKDNAVADNRTVRKASARWCPIWSATG